jgi:imidazoleglycerol-phosphate dehydratase
MAKASRSVRYAEIDRETKESRVHIVLDLDGGTKQDVTTGIGFLDHLLAQMAHHGRFDVGISGEGNLTVDDHHLVDSIATCLGRAFRDALNSSGAIERNASAHVAIDECLVLVVVEVSGRGSYFGNLDFNREKLGTLATESIPVFLSAFAAASGITIHLQVLRAGNSHSLAEAAFKGIGRALNLATRPVDS